ncbi:site-specific integrase [Burkholderia cepacia]|uniref:hypothetical protein n=2 Tax=Burkholderia cepacia complex TaxID=87882 RepID=UPI002990346E|nr:hypothetical protein [Burkholderia cepacia]MDW9243269.1 phage integrase family protein [Burkholderia cepacia]
MTNTAKDCATPADILAQASHVKGLVPSERNVLIVSMRKVSGTWAIVSRYGDTIWWLSGATTNTIKADTKLDFNTLPIEFREIAKAVMYRLMRRGRAGQKRPGAVSLCRTLTNIRLFVQYLRSLGISSLTSVTPLVCSTYRQSCKSRSGRPLAAATLASRLTAVEALFEASQFTDTPILEYPWPDDSVARLAGRKRISLGKQNNTPLMPDEVFTCIFNRAWQILEDANHLLDLRDAIDRLSAESSKLTKYKLSAAREKLLRTFSFSGGYSELKRVLLEIRTAAYIVIASVSGCRNHELAYLRAGAFFSTVDEAGERYWWMRSTSTKTGEGLTEWMIPEAAVTALRVMDRWSIPYQRALHREINTLRAKNRLDPRIAEAEEHLGAVFIGEDMAQEKQVRTLPSKQWNIQLRDFVSRCGLSWSIASHQFRRKFANYAARSQFGDLRYLKEHFKHWSMNMTLTYALNESQEMLLYFEIEDELDALKENVVSGWLNSTTRLSGGYGKALVDWRDREQAITLFKDHAHMVRSIAQSTAIRSNGHAWCTADDNLCVGNTLERTRCADGCENSVIGPEHASIYQGLYDHLATLRTSDDIGKGGRARVQRDLNRCANVLRSLGFAPDEIPT